MECAHVGQGKSEPVVWIGLCHAVNTEEAGGGGLPPRFPGFRDTRWNVFAGETRERYRRRLLPSEVTLTKTTRNSFLYQETETMIGTFKVRTVRLLVRWLSKHVHAKTTTKNHRSPADKFSIKRRLSLVSTYSFTTKFGANSQDRLHRQYTYSASVWVCPLFGQSWLFALSFSDVFTLAILTKGPDLAIDKRSF